MRVMSGVHALREDLEAQRGCSASYSADAGWVARLPLADAGPAMSAASGNKYSARPSTASFYGFCKQKGLQEFHIITTQPPGAS